MAERETPDPTTDDALAGAEAEAAREAAAEAAPKIVTPKVRTSGTRTARAATTKSAGAAPPAVRPAAAEPAAVGHAVARLRAAGSAAGPRTDSAEEATKVPATLPIEPPRNVSGDTITVRQSGIESVTATNIDIRQGGIGRARATDIAVTQGGVGAARADHVSVELGGIGAALTGELTIRQGAAGTIVARDARVEQSVVRVLVANEVHVERSTGVLFLIARKVDACSYDQRADMPTTIYYAYWRNVAPYDDQGPLIMSYGSGRGYGYLLMDSADGMTCVAVEGRSDALELGDEKGEFCGKLFAGAGAEGWHMSRLLKGLVLLLGLALAACGHAPAPPPRPLTTSAAPTPEVKEGAAKTGQGGPVDADTQAAIDRGVAQGRSGDLDGARRTFQDVVARNPNAGAAWVNLGVIAERKGDVAEAEADYRRAAQTTPEPPESWDFLARLMVRGSMG
jgi:hypothetical protein